MIIENEIYQDLRAYVKEHWGVGSEFKDTELCRRYTELSDRIKALSGQKVKLTYAYTNDILRGSGEKIGRLGTEGDRIKFYEGRNRTRFQYLDCGLFEGFYATLIVKSIETL